MKRKLGVSLKAFSRLLFIGIFTVILIFTRTVVDLLSLEQYYTADKFLPEKEQQGQEQIIVVVKNKLFTNDADDVLDETKENYGATVDGRKYHGETFNHFLLYENNNLNDEDTPKGGGDITTTSLSRPIAILHIGPHKTGSTTIQSYTRTFVKELASDGYEIPWVDDDGDHYLETSQVQLATCFLNKPFVHPVYPCDQRLVESAKKIAKRNINILISSEAFDRPDVNMTLLTEFLKPWNVTVVYVYRRFYSWLQSYHNQVGKSIEMLKTFLANSTDYLRANINDFILQEFINSTTAEYVDRFTSAQRYQRDFDNHDVVILNMHDKNVDIVQQFFCKAIPHADNTCNAVKNHKDDGETVYNPSSGVLTYYDLAYRAHRLGMIHISTQEQLHAAVEMIEQHQKVTLNLTDYDFDVVCPDEAILDSLLKTSLEMETLMVPEFFASSLGESELRTDFEKKAKSSLCPIDISGTIESSQWKGFFASLNDRLHNIKD